VDSRRFIVAVLIFVGALLAFALFMHSRKAQRQVQSQPATAPAATQSVKGDMGKQAEAGAGAGASTRPALPPVEPSTRPADSQPAESQAAEDGETIGIYAESVPDEVVRIGSLDPRSGYMFEIELIGRGAAAKSLTLAGDFATVADKRRFDLDPDTYDQACNEDPEKYHGHYVLLGPVGPDPDTAHLPMATGMLTVEIPGESCPVDPVDMDTMNWRVVGSGPDEGQSGTQAVSFAAVLYAGRNTHLAKPLLKVVKTFTVRKGDYSFGMSIRLENLTDREIRVTLDQAGPSGLPREGFRADMRKAAYGIMRSESQKVQTRLKNASDAKKASGAGQVEPLGNSEGVDPTVWIGMVNKFFGSMMYLKPTVAGRVEAPTYMGEFRLRTTGLSAERRTYLTSVLVPSLQVRSHKVRQIDFEVFAGPKKRDVFVNPDDDHFKPLYKDLHYIGTIDFGGCFCTFNWLALAMMWLLNFFAANITFGNFGVAIILLVLLVRLVLHPLTKKSQVSMMRMQKLGPQMQKLKDKYADDKNALNKETMKLYKEQGASPILGCLPMFLQMPLWVALFTGLNAAVELRHAAFLPVWITDLSSPDALFNFPVNLPFVGPTFNLLPLLLTVAMFIQQQFSPQSAQAGAGSEQAQQTQKMMKYMFPVMMLVFFYKAPSGLTLYIMASTFGGVLDQYFVRRHIKEKEAEEAARQTTVAVPGKASRSSRPKKPKGPLWMKHG